MLFIGSLLDNSRKGKGTLVPCNAAQSAINIPVLPGLVSGDFKKGDYG